MEKKAKEKTSSSIRSSISNTSTKSLEGRQTSAVSSEVSSSTKDEGEKVVKLPPIKAPVGLAKGPDLKNCKSKVGSLNNIKHKPVGGKITIESQKLKWNAKSKVGSLENKEHKPGGGKIKVETQKLQWNTTSKVQSLQNVHHKPGGGNIKIFNESYAENNKTANPSADSSESSSSKATTTISVDKKNDTSKNNTPAKPNTISITDDMKSLNLKG